jgi:CheY-like chemotaxis protein
MLQLITQETMKLLIVDDNPEMRRLIKSVVADLAEDIAECTDGAEALTAYRQQLPDWVLMDVEMPVLDGLAATRQIIADFPNARVAIVTRHSHEKLRAAARESGACAYVLKEDLFSLRSLIAGDQSQT